MSYSITFYTSADLGISQYSFVTTNGDYGTAAGGTGTKVFGNLSGTAWISVTVKSGFSFSRYVYRTGSTEGPVGYAYSETFDYSDESNLYIRAETIENTPEPTTKTITYYGRYNDDAGAGINYTVVSYSPGNGRFYDLQTCYHGTGTGNVYNIEIPTNAIVIQFQATAKSGYSFSHWRYQGADHTSDTNNPKPMLVSEIPNSGFSIMARAKSETHSIIVNIPTDSHITQVKYYNSQTGTKYLSPSSQLQEITGLIGNTIFTATTDTANGYTFKEWVNANRVAISTDNPYEHAASDSAYVEPVAEQKKHSLHVIFDTAKISSVRYSNSISGQTGTHTQGNLSLTNLIGNTVLTAYANTTNGYTFSKWVDGGGTSLATTATYTHTASDPALVEAIAEKQTYTVTFNFGTDAHIASYSYSTTDGQSGTVTSAGNKTGLSGTITITATPASGYSFSSWTYSTGGATVTIDGNKISFKLAANSTVGATASQTGACWVYVSGSGWKKAIPWVYSGGWKKATPWVYNGGWKKSTI